MAATLYRRLEVWRRHDASTGIRYTCIEDVRAQKFYAKSADHIRYPLDKTSLAQMDAQATELVLDFLAFQEAEEIEWSNSVEAAVSAFDLSFDD